MNCPKCNAFNMNSAKFCSHCGMKFDESGSNSQANQQSYQGAYNQNNYNNQSNYQGTYSQQNNQYNPQPQYPQNAGGEKYSGLAIASFVISLAGLIIAGIICGIIGTIFASIALYKMSQDSRIKGKGLALAGLVISIIDVVVMIIFLAQGASMLAYYF
ncbi:MAG: DUF4190 domain-containing protein [Clostridia bacterium]|nr:DUF4190 domain-containing protein [Clostridia bacterium]